MERLLPWATSFGRFWYHFLIGDNWSMAVVVAVGLAITALLHAWGMAAWWLLPPPLAVAALGVSLRRAGR